MASWGLTVEIINIPSHAAKIAMIRDTFIPHLSLYFFCQLNLHFRQTIVGLIGLTKSKSGGNMQQISTRRSWEVKLALISPRSSLLQLGHLVLKILNIWFKISAEAVI